MRTAVRGAVKLFFVWQAAPEPVGVGGRFGMADVNRPIEREANFLEHRARHPHIAIANPEDGMLDAGRFFPGPAAIGPKRAMLIAAGLDEAQKIGVGDVVALDGKSRNADDALAALVVPAKCFLVRFAEAKSGFAFGDFDEVRFERPAVRAEGYGLCDFAVVGNAVEQVRKGFGVHEAMFYRGFEHFQKLGMSLTGVLERGVDSGVQFFAKALIVEIDLAASGPVERTVRRKASTDRIDAERE